MQLNTLVMADICNAAPRLPSLPTAATLMVYSLFEVNPVMFALVPCTLRSLPSSGDTDTRYPVLVFASPPNDGSSQLILIDDFVTLLMLDECGWSKTIR